ncbi:transcription antitermination factor NusB [Georgenia sp. 10Sc9-8]|uniref:Transcription antitermination factor NusB n=1 Tax=Georgenia halotolerans TaxID=3028317 RepID=A0ABT5U0C4_9MICO|nr:transcription antitermination factor NusB [Georgenia halotolerans]
MSRPDGDGRRPRSTPSRRTPAGGASSRGAPAPRTTGPRRSADPARAAALDALTEVESSDAYANLVLPPLLRERGITGRDAAFTTELVYGTLRLRGRYDAILERCTRGRPLSGLDVPVRHLLRLGAHQLLGMRVPAHAAVGETVQLARERAGVGASQLVNAVLRAVGRRPLAEWLDVITAESGDEIAGLAAASSHPVWMVRALRQSLLATGRPADELPAVLEADNAGPLVSLVARPGLVSPEELREQAGRAAPAEPGRWSPLAVLLPGGDPATIPAVRRARAGVQDEGSQLVALALAAAPLTAGHDGSAPDTRWLDLCAGPGGKAALLGAVAAQQGATLVANEIAPHRAELVRRSVAAVPTGTVTVRTGDGRDVGAAEPGRYDRVLVDAPCTGLGALRRRPESRWRRTAADLTGLGPLQRALLDSALDATRPGGVVAYVTCSPHVAETRLAVDDVIRRREDAELIDAVAPLQEVSAAPLPGLGEGPTTQLWPHLHGTDAMFLALLRRR